MCFLKHKWGKWSSVLGQAYNSYIHATGQIIKGVQSYQTRTCQRCGKISVKFLP